MLRRFLCLLLALLLAAPVQAIRPHLKPVLLVKQGGGSPLRFATNSNVAPTATQSLSGIRLYQISRRAFWIGSGDMSRMVLSFPNWTLGTSGTTANGNAYTIIKCALEKDGSGFSVPVTFRHQRSKVVDAGATDVQSDSILPSSFGLTKFTLGDKYWLRIQVSVAASGMTLPKGQPYNGTGGGSFPTWVGFAYEPGENPTVESVDSSGTISTGNGTFTNNINPVAYVVLGSFINGDPPTWLGIGDSIVYGLNDTHANVGFSGFFQRALVNDAENGSWVGGMNFGISGGKASAWSATGAAAAIAYWKYAKYAVEEFGTNDFSAGDSLATAESRVQSLWSLLYGAGIKGILRTKVLPRVTTTDAYVTEANQTAVNSSFTAGGNADLFNTWLSTQIGATGPTSVIAFTSLLGVDPWKWVVNGSSNYATNDGTHPSPAMHGGSGFMATLLRNEMTGGSYP